MNVIKHFSTKGKIQNVCSKANYSAAIIGAGLSGVNMAKQCIDLGIPFKIFEVCDQYGGTWVWNDYPGCGCDVPSHLYSFSWCLNPGWQRKWAKRDEILQYINKVAREVLKLEPFTSFNTKVVSAKWIEEAYEWELTLQDLTPGSTKNWTERHKFLLAATGQLNIPKIPDNLNPKNFQGVWFHTARWDKNASLKNKTVLCIGSGASAVQALPAIQPEVKELLVFQRSPSWFIDKADYKYSNMSKKIFKCFPFTMKIIRWLYLSVYDFLWIGAIGNYKNNTISYWNKLFQKYSLYQFRSHKLFPKGMERQLIPNEPFGCKRILLSSEWLIMFDKPNVKLITAAVKEITPQGIKTDDGIEFKADVIVYATGFESHNFVPIDIRGKNSLELHKYWNGEPHAYLTMFVPYFPNLAIIYGPNANINHSNVETLLECGSEYIAKVLKRTILQKKQSFEVLEPSYEAFDKYEQDKLSQTTFAANCTSWYKKSPNSRIINVWHGPIFLFWLKTRFVKWKDFLFT